MSSIYCWHNLSLTFLGEYRGNITCLVSKHCPCHFTSWTPNSNIFLKYYVIVTHFKSNIVLDEWRTFCCATSSYMRNISPLPSKLWLDLYPLSCLYLNDYTVAWKITWHSNQKEPQNKQFQDDYKVDRFRASLILTIDCHLFLFPRVIPSSCDGHLRLRGWDPASSPTPGGWCYCHTGATWRQLHLSNCPSVSGWNSDHCGHPHCCHTYRPNYSHWSSHAHQHSKACW